jgi:arylsulfatase A-like enzyme
LRTTDLLFFAAILLAAGAAPAAPRPNVVVLLADDLGFSDLGATGGEIRTPALDALAAEGLLFTQFYATPRCSPTRASLLTGMHPHAAGVGHLASTATEYRAYTGAILPDVATLPERLREAGYHSYAVGKWHLDPKNDPAGPNAPVSRGFERWFGVMRGADDYYHPESLGRDTSSLPDPGDGFYLTDALAKNAGDFIRDHRRDHPDDPFFLYFAFTAPHWPMQAPAEDVARYADHYADGWDAARTKRHQRLRELGLIRPGVEPAPRDPAVEAWTQTEHSHWQSARMRAYAAMVDRMDQAVAQVLAVLDETHARENTIVFFLSDNGACAEELPPWSGWLRRFAGLWTPDHYGDDPGVDPGEPESFQAYGRGWSNVSNAPFRGHKSGLYEGGIASPLIVRWPGALAVRPDARTATPSHVVDVAATILDLAGVAGNGLDGIPLTDVLQGVERIREEPIVWEHEGWRAIRDGHLKAVARWRGDWELYDLADDPTEQLDLAAHRPNDVARLASQWQAWSDAAGVQPWPWVMPEAGRIARFAGIFTTALVVGLILIVRRVRRR